MKRKKEINIFLGVKVFAVSRLKCFLILGNFRFTKRIFFESDDNSTTVKQIHLPVGLGYQITV